MSNEENLIQSINKVNNELDNIYTLFKEAYDKNLHKICVNAGEFLLKILPIKNNDKYEEIKFLLSVCYFYIGNKTRGLELTDHIYINKQKYHEFAMKNLVHYVNKIDSKVVNIDVKKPINVDGKEWNLSNPSIIKVNNHETIKYMINCRIVNYYEKDGLYFSKDEDGIVRTRNILLFVNESFEKIKQNEFICKYDKKRSSHITGLEDVRIFSNNDIVYFTTVTYDNHNSNKPKISTGSYLIHDVLLLKDEEPFYFNKLNPKNSLKNDECEKNWLPFTINHEFHTIYSFSPTIIMNVSSEQNIIIYKNKYENNRFHEFRGGAGPILFEYKDQIGYLTIVHEVIFEKFKDRWIRKYVHRFVWIDNNFFIKFISLPFYFIDLGIEYCAGMSSNDKHIILTIGSKDSNGFIILCDKNEISKLLFSCDKRLEEIFV
jgi:hypothetical protein